MSKESNSFVHPNVFLNVVSSVEKNKDLKKFLIANVELLSRAYELLLEKYNSSNQPYLNCAHNHYCTRNCSECYKKEINNFTFIVSNELFEEKNSFYGYC